MLDAPSLHRGNGNAEVGNTLNEIEGAIERIDNPVELSLRVQLTRFFAADAVFRVRLVEGVGNDLLRLPIDVGDEIVDGLLRNLELVATIHGLENDRRGLTGGAERNASLWLHERFGIRKVGRHPSSAARAALTFSR